MHKNNNKVIPYCHARPSVSCIQSSGVRRYTPED